MMEKIQHRDLSRSCFEKPAFGGALMCLLVAGLLLLHGVDLPANPAIAKERKLAIDCLTTYVQGLGAYDVGRYEKAEALLTEVISAKPTDAGALSVRGLVRGKRQRFAEAMQDHARAIALNPNIPALYDARGQTEAEAVRFSEAVKDYTSAIKMGSKFDAMRPLWHRAGALRVSGHPSEALKDLEESLTIDATFPEPYYYRALAREQLGDLSGARKDLDLAKQFCTEKLRRKQRHRPSGMYEVLLQSISTTLSNWESHNPR